jgi:AcrR family transcriptional regulator
MAAPSLYSYFAAKEAIYDAMFAQGYSEFLGLERQPGVDLRDELGLRTRDYFRFCLDDPVRYQLLFQRTVPGFEPSAESWNLAQQAYARSLGGLVEFGLSQRGLDVVTAVMTGLVDQQISNDPGGQRWVTLVDDVVDMLLWHLTREAAAAPGQRSATITTE